MLAISNVAGAGTPTIKSFTQVGSNLQAIGADRTSNIWVAGSAVGDNSVANQVFVIAKDTAVATTVTGITLASGGNILAGTLFRPSNKQHD